MVLLLKNLATGGTRYFLKPYYDVTETELRTSTFTYVAAFKSFVTVMVLPLKNLATGNSC